MGCGVVERHLEMAQPTKKTIILNGQIEIKMTKESVLKELMNRLRDQSQN